MKETPLARAHLELNARLTEFAGFNMPVYYNSISEEHHSVRNSVGVFDVSHMGEFIVKGKQALDLVNRISSNDASKIQIGQAQYSCIPNDIGGIVDDLLVYRLPEDQCSEGEQAFMLVVNASNIKKDFDWIQKHNSYDTRLMDISDRTGLLAVQGPKATELLQKFCPAPLDEIAFYHFVKTQFGGIDNVLVSATGYTGSGGFELYASNEDTVRIWDLIFSEADLDLQPAGLGARDTLRLEMGYSLYGNDIDDNTSPIEAGLGWITKTAKDCDFPSKHIFQKQRKEGVTKKLCGFILEGRRVPRKDYPIRNVDSELIGKVTSGTMSPSLSCPIGMGYVKPEYAKQGADIHIEIGNKMYAARVVKMPFYTPV